MSSETMEWRATAPGSCLPLEYVSERPARVVSFAVPRARYYQLLVVSCELSVVGCRLSVVGCRLSVVGCRLSVRGSRAGTCPGCLEPPSSSYWALAPEGSRPRSEQRRGGKKSR